MYYLIPALIITALLIVERLLHMRRLETIPIRIHVNGIRGKSTVTRLIAQALNEAGIPTLAKVTGNKPLILLPDGSEKPLRRLGPTRISEQLRIIRLAAEMKVQAVVIECMAVEPDYQFVSEQRMIRSTIGVITNVRPDHFEQMGPGLDHIADALSRTIPRNGDMVTADEDYFEFFKKIALARNSRASFVSKAEKAFPGNSQNAPPFTENFLIAQEVCRILNVNTRADAMHRKQAWLKPAAFDFSIGARRIYFVDGFAANDTVSAQRIIRWAIDSGLCPKPIIVLLNSRSDRPLRLKEFIRLLAGPPFFEGVGLMGDLIFMARRMFRSMNLEVPLFICRGKSPEAILDSIFRFAGVEQLTLISLGNQKGMASLLSEYCTLRRST